ncbi:radical SAM protein [Actinokineospora sp. UTMC 2448]|uniref:radical SAM protein n=1 Tax=Actinokineospora sp. UTMC 2448 TaxID=2268449 RepID=UPI002164B4BA|nr:radical SAM protein [Actinokineospora sp. UTMC 2448]UVS77318.1 pyrroloquinoline quinone biosynthesis protein PqqE [Actinokineospora sp. UTMC 2448]
MSLGQISRAGGDRILRGERNWWFLGPGGIARLRERHIAEDGTVRPEALRRLDESGLMTAKADNSYSLTVLTSTDCNLGCGYCFQNTSQDTGGGSRPPRIAHARLTSDTITSILAFTDRQMAASGLDDLRILLFGGEPLLNPRGCIELLARAADHGLTSARMVSNLTLLSPQLAAQLAELKLKHIQVTFDGDRAEHDRIRVRRSTGGTFDTIVRNIVRATEVTDIRWTLRVNVSHHNHHGIDAMIDRLADAVDPARCAIYFAQVGDIGIGYANRLTHTDELIARFVRWQRAALDRGFTVNRPGPKALCATCGPGDGSRGGVVNADGTLASCWETAGKPGWEVGTVDTGYLPAEQTRDRWIGCGDSYRQTDGADVLAAFRDGVDSALLDYLDATGRL